MKTNIQSIQYAQSSKIRVHVIGPISSVIFKGFHGKCKIKTSAWDSARSRAESSMSECESKTESLHTRVRCQDHELAVLRPRPDSSTTTLHTWLKYNTGIVMLHCNVTNNQHSWHSSQCEKARQHVDYRSTEWRIIMFHISSLPFMYNYQERCTSFFFWVLSSHRWKDLGAINDEGI